MKAFFAVGDAAMARSVLAGHRMLISFAHIGEDDFVPEESVNVLAGLALELLIDCGEFTEWNRRREGKKPKGITLESFFAWLRSKIAERPDLFATMRAFAPDVIGDAAASMRRWREALRVAPDLAPRLIPVWHEGDPIEHLAEYNPAARRVALGRIAGRRSVPKTFDFYDEAFNRFPRGQFHALGNCNPETLEPYPFEEFDGVTWQLDSTFGNKHRWPWSRVSKRTRMFSYVEATETIEHRPAERRRQLSLAFAAGAA